MEDVLSKNDELLAKWNKLTDLGRNEWICWTISVKKEETRKEHVIRMVEEISNGKRRPCCWAGCSHRKKEKNGKF